MPLFAKSAAVFLLLVVYASLGLPDPLNTAEQSPVIQQDGATGKPCVVGGCSGQVCGDTSVITTCEWREEYACYRRATCERDASGKCGWRMTESLRSCLARRRNPATNE